MLARKSKGKLKDFFSKGDFCLARKYKGGLKMT